MGIYHLKLDLKSKKQNNSLKLKLENKFLGGEMLVVEKSNFDSRLFYFINTQCLFYLFA